MTATAATAGTRRRWRPHFGLAARLYVGIGGAVAFTLVASVVAWLSFIELSEHQREITGQHLPAIEGSLRLAQQSAAIAATAPKLLNAVDESERAAVLADLAAQETALQRLLDQLEGVLADERHGAAEGADGRATALPRVRALVEELQPTLADLGYEVGVRISLDASMRQRVASAVEAHRRLVETIGPMIDDDTFYLITGFRSLSDPRPVPLYRRVDVAVLTRYAALTELAAEANLLVGLLTESLSVPTVPLLQPLRERFEAASDRFASALAQLEGSPQRDRLLTEYRKLVLLGSGVGGIVELRERSIVHEQAAQDLLQRSRELAATLTGEVEGIVAGGRQGTVASVLASDESIEFGRGLLLLLNGLAILGAVLLCWLYVKRSFTDPVLQITAAAQDFERQRFEPAMLARPSRRRDELGNLARVFTRMAEEVQQRTDTLDRLVAERTAELNEKNRALEQSMRQIAEELAMAQRMQLSILPREVPALSELSLFARMRAARSVGGDFYDIIELDDERLGLVIADVSDKGVPAALLMAVACTKIKAIARACERPGDVLEQLNEQLADGNEAAMFVTVFYGILDHRAGRLTYANGGHDAPFLQRGDAKAEPLPRTGGLALGLMPGMTYEEESVALSPGDTVFFYTDGVTEAFNSQGDPFTALRLKQVLYEARSLSVQELGHRVIADLEHFTEGTPQSDDITCVVLRYHPAVSDDTSERSDDLAAGSWPFEHRLAGGLEGLAALAEAVEGYLEGEGLPPRLAFQLNLVLDELLTNTVNYGCAGRAGDCHVLVRMRREPGEIAVLLEDDATPFNPLDAPPPDLEKSLEDRPIGGLGVHLVRNTMDSLVYRHEAGFNRLAMRKRLDD